MSFEIGKLRELLSQGTQGPWFWSGNVDTHTVALCGRQPGLGVCEVLSTIDVERDPDDRDAQQLREALADGGVSDKKWIEDYVRETWAEDEWGQPRTDRRLAITTGDHIRANAEDYAVFEVARNRGLPDDTPRDDQRIYRGDVCDIRLPNARLIVEAVNALPALLDALEAAEAEVARMRQLHRPVRVAFLPAACCEGGHDHDRCVKVSRTVCAECARIGGVESESSSWPCQTAQERHKGER